MAEKILIPRVFIGSQKMTDAQVNAVVTDRKIPDGLTDGILLANDFKTQYEAHRVDVVAHNSADTTNVINAATATDLATLLLLANDIKTQYNAHCADAVAHNSPDITNVITAATATDIATAVTLLNDAKVMYGGHCVDIVAHNSADTTNVITAIDAYSWVQIFTGTEGVDITTTREVQPTENQQMGITGKYIMSQSSLVKIPLSSGGFTTLLKYAQLDPDAASDATGGNYKANIGVRLEGITFLIYDKQTDNTNQTNIPNFVDDDNTKIFFDGVSESDVVESYNGEQNIVTLDLTPLSSASNTGSGCGIPGCFGTFEKVS